MHLAPVSFVGLVGLALALAVPQRPADTSICDFYAHALLQENNATTQAALLILLVNTAVIGNYSDVNVGVKVPGILAPSRYNNTEVDLLPFFNGRLASTNHGGRAGAVVDFLDDGGAAPLMANMAAKGTSSNQYNLLTHLYQFFGTLLACSKMGTADFPSYAGEKSMYDVHKFMALDAFQVGYFVTQVGLSAASFGVATADIEAVGKALMDLFGHKCAPPATVVLSQGPQLQSVCIADNCPLAPNGNCSAYEKVVRPLAANASMGTATTAPMSATSSTTMARTAAGGSSATGTSSIAGMPTHSGTVNSTGMGVQMVARFGSAAALVGAAALAFTL